MTSILYRTNYINDTANDDALGIPAIVNQLREVRLTSLQGRKRLKNPPKLPSRKKLEGIINGLAAALFPNRLGTPDLKQEGLDYFVGHTLDVALHELIHETVLELNFAEVSAKLNNTKSIPSDQSSAVNIVSQFAKKLPALRMLLDTDIQAAFDGDPAATSVDEVLVCYPGVLAMIHYRMAHELYKLGLPIIARMISEIAHTATGVDIHPGAQIDASFFIDHCTGVVIGETCIIGKHVRIYQGVTLGAKRFPTDAEGILLKGLARHPIVEDHVVVYAGATVLGRITIGAGSSIGGNVWLTHSVPPNSTITQAQTQHKATPEE